MQQRHDENLKLQLKHYNVDPPENSSATCISTCQEISFSVVQDLFQASKLVNENI